MKYALPSGCQAIKVQNLLESVSLDHLDTGTNTQASFTVEQNLGQIFEFKKYNVLGINTCGGVRQAGMDRVRS